MSDAILVEARLASPLAGDPPHLDSLLEHVLSRHHPKGVPGHKIDRRWSAPAQAEIPIPILRHRIGQVVDGGEVREWVVARCSSPILSSADIETVEYINKRLSVENAALLDPSQRLIVMTTKGWTKSYRLPLRVRRVDRVRWFTVGDRRSVLVALRRVQWLGKKTADGYGRVVEWTVDRVEADCSWFGPHESGPVLMRPLPITDDLPANLLGARRDFGACCPPYWHPERYTEIVTPC